MPFQQEERMREGEDFRERYFFLEGIFLEELLGGSCTRGERKRKKKL